MDPNQTTIHPGDLCEEIHAWSLFTWLARFGGSPYYAIVS